MRKTKQRRRENKRALKRYQQTKLKSRSAATRRRKARKAKRATT